MGHTKITVVFLVLGVFSFFAAGSARAQSQARADLKDGSGKSVGTATIRETKEGVAINVRVKGLTQGLHAVHIHAVGKCEGPKFTSAGGHFNPLNKKHGLKNQEGSHAGDLPNMYVTKAGIGQLGTIVDGVSLKAGETSIFDQDGSALVIHASGDDDTSDPAGNAGDRIACGVLTKVVPKKKQP